MRHAVGSCAKRVRTSRLSVVVPAAALGAGICAAGVLAAIAAAGGLHVNASVSTAAGASARAPLSRPATNTNAGNDRRGDTDTAAECPPGYGGDPCVRNGNSQPGVTKGHGNCDDNQGKGSNGNDNGNFRPCPATTSVPRTTTTTGTTPAPSSTTTAAAATPTLPAPTSAQPSPTPTRASTTTAQTTTSAALGTTKSPARLPAKPRVHAAVRTLPFTGLPLWIDALAALGMIVTGLFARRLARGRR